MARLRVLAITAVAVIAISEAQAVDTSNNAAETEEVTVTAEATGSLTSLVTRGICEAEEASSGSLHSQDDR
jgi:hypothetical protein